MKRKMSWVPVTAVLLAGLIPAGEVSAAETGSARSSSETTKQRVSVKAPHGKVHHGDDFSGAMRRRDEDIEDVERKLASAPAGSRRYMMLKQKRDKLALEMIHDIQHYLMTRLSPASDIRLNRMRDRLANEIRVISPSLKEIENFPFPDRMDDMPGLIREIQTGKVKYSGRIAKSETLMLREIQREQTKALQEFHRQQLK